MGKDGGVVNGGIFSAWKLRVQGSGFRVQENQNINYITIKGSNENGKGK